MFKKLILSGIALVAGLAVQAQTFTVTPASATAEDRITITVDVTGFAALENESPLYIWAWSNLGDAPNGSWNSSAETAKMTQDATNPKKWSFSFVPSVYYNKPAGGFTFVGFLVKGKDGSAATPGGPERKTADQTKQLEAIAFNPSTVRRFPTKFTEDDVLSVFYDKTLDNNTTMKNIGRDSIAVFTQVKVKDANGVESGWTYTKAEWSNVGDTLSLRMKPITDSLFRWTIIPSKFFAKQPGETISQIKVHVRSAGQPVFGGSKPAASKGDEIYTLEPKQ